MIDRCDWHVTHLPDWFLEENPCFLCRCFHLFCPNLVTSGVGERQCGSNWILSFFAFALIDLWPFIWPEPPLVWALMYGGRVSTDELVSAGQLVPLWVQVLLTGSKVSTCHTSQHPSSTLKNLSQIWVSMTIFSLEKCHVTTFSSGNDCVRW